MCSFKKNMLTCNHYYYNSKYTFWLRQSMIWTSEVIGLNLKKSKFYVPLQL